MLIFLTRKLPMPTLLDPKLYYLLLNFCFCVTSWPYALSGDNCPSSRWSVMCRPCCEYHLIQCRCPSTGSRVGYTVPCCRNALDQCDPCIFHPGCSLFENCKTCHNGTWKANDDFFVNGKYCTECRQGWSGGDCKTCGGIIQRAQGHIALESYPTNARCEWTIQVPRGSSIELRFSLLSLESDHNCRYDYVEVRDGDDLSFQVIGRFCGDQLPPPIKSSGNVLHILFTSDGYNNFDGFVLTFQESSVSASRKPVCAPPETLVNGYFLPVYGLKDEIVSVNYRCHSPFVLTGSEQRTCLPNGIWSGTLPICIKGQTSRVQCPRPPKLLNGYHRPVVDTAGGAETIEFFCKNTYVLSGNHQSTCLSNGSWSIGPPKCVKACREPKVSELVLQSVVKPHLLSRESPNQRLRLTSRYSMHDLLSAGFIPLTLDRQSNVERDVEELPRGFHSVHTSIDYKCASPIYRHTGSSRRTCLRTGRWSGRHVSCSPVCGKFDTFSHHNLSDTQWPWHAAIYIRSPPNHTASTRRSRGITVSDQQEASEESTFWYLACSGALLTQRSVLVAAQCVVDKDKQQPLHSAHVKVVIGMQHRTSKDPLKSHHLRVSDILVHPNFYFAPDSNVAVLKLKDKAKISERVLPVCLPKMQGGEVTVQEAYTARWILPNNRRHLSRYSALSQTKLLVLTDVAQCEREFAQGGTHTTVISDNTLCGIRKPSSPESPCPSVIPGLTTVPAVFSSTSGVLSGHEESQGASSTGWQLLGLETFNYEEKNCHQQTYTVQTQIGNFRNWIEKNMN
ncbi:inactive serine protease PAMR1-like isoform X1 [Lates japonicus]|uniref:Inactive serine protease PAMR1-like isoform X1 n=1 Tax=Lates japonicus TaxID=270547 RepID=A0AAD3MKI6_LATJO|nr:inactive serine protease PAMR1-like isoform X1 [Lates japonicus]